MTHRETVILLVEDDENDVFFFRRALAKADSKLSFHLVTDGELALQYLNGQGNYADRAAHPLPDIVFLDLKLPYLSGMKFWNPFNSNPP